jgi:hypothetical protein
MDHHIGMITASLDGLVAGLEEVRQPAVFDVGVPINTLAYFPTG